MTERVSDYLDLLDRLGRVFEGHPDVARVSLMLKPEGLALAPGEVLVEQPNSQGERILTPYQLTRPAPTGTAVAVTQPASREAQSAIALASRLWTAVLRSGGLEPFAAVPTHLPGFFDPGELQKLRLPIGQDLQSEQRIALADHGIQMERPDSPHAVAIAYNQNPRTRVYESINTRSEGAWSLVALLLSHLAGCHVIATIYESAAGDATMGEHFDDWHGLVVQYKGCKRWAWRTDRTSEPVHVDVQAGDLFVLPRDLLHDVSTPETSIHVLFAIQTHHPLTTRRACP